MSRMSLEFRTLQPEEFYRQHIEAGVRPDGRKLGERRAMAVSAGNIATADGSAIVRLGSTSVVCGVRAELAPPRPEEPEQGYLVPNISLPAMCSPHCKPGPPSMAAQAATQFLSRVLESSGCVSTADLVVAPGRLVWCLYIDLVCLDHSGNLWDCAVAALVAALGTVSLPQVQYSTVQYSTAHKRMRWDSGIASPEQKSVLLSIVSIRNCWRFRFGS